MILSKRAIVATTAGLLAVGGAAYAFYSGTGTGTGTGTNSGGTAALTLSSGSLSGLSPGRSVRAVVTTTNSGSESATVSTIKAGPLTTNKPGCLSEWFTVMKSNPGGPVIVPANSRERDNFAQTGTIEVTFNNVNVNQDACKNAVITVALSTPDDSVATTPAPTATTATTTAPTATTTTTTARTTVTPAATTGTRTAASPSKG